jgi:hypothetical protein
LAQLSGLLACLLPFLLLGQATQAQDTRPEPAQRRNLTSIRHHSEGRSTLVVVEADGPLAYAYSSPDAWSAVVELPGCDASALPGRIEIDTPEVELVRIETGPGLDGAERVQIEVSLRGPYYHQVYLRGNDLHLVFERPPAPRNATPAPDLGTAGHGASAPVTDLPDGPAGEVSTPAWAASTPEPAKSSPSPTDTAETEPDPSPAEPVAGPPPNPRRAPTRPASRILDVVVDTEGGRLAVTVTANGSLLYEDFFVETPPDRLVLDFADVVIDPANQSWPVNQGVLLGVRVAQFNVSPQRIVRLVLDLQSRPGYHILERADGITIELEPPPPPQP